MSRALLLLGREEGMDRGCLNPPAAGSATHGLRRSWGPTEGHPQGAPHVSSKGVDPALVWWRHQPVYRTLLSQDSCCTPCPSHPHELEEIPGVLAPRPLL